eukprot:CAMPEP_0197421626 /NCGR_PEP_ID=MMETSP1170-20131217/9894_1 /TAXON_ID=54406 /ORGANISM="Sarcinochrysis sp, Strain CCMP770" /LENGTH=231 /DNA_ID=CAMNT_0042948889 /DNA_START=51 /DNA_END=746 /DNA_ORIENTATION=+
MNRVTILALALTTAAGFVPTTPAVAGRAVALNAYVPDGLTPEQWASMKKKEADDKKKKNFGAGGARGFKSRSMQSFVAALEQGEATHLFAVNPEKVKRGEIALKDVPYMQRGGSWDNSDLSGKKGWMNTGFGMRAFNDGKAEIKKENKYDAQYNNLKPSISFFGTDIAIDWSGKGAANDGVAARAKKNGISNDQQMWRDAGALSVEEARKRRGGAPKIAVGGEKKKLFGLF